MLKKLAKALAATLLIFLSIAAYSITTHINAFNVPLIPYSTFKDTVPSHAKRFIIIADTQRTSWMEKLLLREVNDQEQRLLLKHISKQPTDFMVMLGDLVFDASSKKHWAYYDYLMQDIAQKNIPILLAKGNHEYWGKKKKALTNIQKRFPYLEGSSWYSKTSDFLGMVFLDSNFEELSKDQNKQQLNFLEKTLNDFDSDSNIKGVIIFMHHPAYTNSPYLQTQTSVLTKFIPTICNSTKRIAVITGHSHGYERFMRGEKESCGKNKLHFIVSGGGGGPRPHTLLNASETGKKDFFVGGSPRPLNYLTADISQSGVHIKAWGLNTGEQDVSVFDQLKIKYPDKNTEHP